MKSNESKYIIHYMITTCINAVLIGAVFQAFLLEKGILESSVSLFESGMLIFQSIIMLLISNRVERMENVIGWHSLSSMARGLVLIPMFIFCVVQGVKPTAVFVIIIVVKVISSVFEGIYSVIAYKLPYHIMDINRYGKLLSKAGVIGSVLAIVLSFVISFITDKLGFFGGMKYILIFCIAISVIGYYIAISMKRINNTYTAKEEKNQEITGSIWKYKPFYMFILPNLGRGIASGVLNVATVIGYYYNIIDAKTAVIIAIILPVSTALGTLVYGKASDKNIDGIMIFISSILVAVSMFFFTGIGTNVFLVSLFIAKTFMSIIDYAVPVWVVKNIDYSYIGRYSAIRMLLHTGGTAIGSGVVILMIKSFGGFLTMLISGICILLCGVAYFLGKKLYQ